MTLPVLAFLWGLIAGSALVLGCLVGYFMAAPRIIIATIMAFGSGVLMSMLSFDLMEHAYERGGFLWTAAGFLVGALLYTMVNTALCAYGAEHRKRSGPQQPSESDKSGSGLAIAAGSLLDGIPESMVIGLSLLPHGSVSSLAVAAIFLSNIPEGLSSAAGMREAGRPAKYVFGVWITIAVISGVASLLGFLLFRNMSPGVVAAVTAIAAGALLAMVANTMIPEAFEHAHNLTGAITVLGFLLAFGLAKAAN